MARRYLLCSDLDRTAVPNGPAPESAGAASAFAALAGREDVTLAYVSGRHRTLVENAISEYGLPMPDFVMGDVGTTLYRVEENGEWALEQAWERRIGQDWGGHISSDLLPLLDGIEGLRAQEPEKQNRFKLSFYLEPERWNDEFAKSTHSRLSAANVQARLVWSIDDLTGDGLLDILPRSASKLGAIDALIEFEGYDLESTVFCGDSGNDLDVLASPIPSVLVANAQPEVKEQAAAMARDAGYEEQLYIARGGFRGMNGNYRGGILEGVAHYHPELQPEGNPP